MSRKLFRLSIRGLLVALSLTVLAACAETTATSSPGQGVSPQASVPQMTNGEAAFVGVVQSIGANTYTVGGATFTLASNSELPTGLAVGATVKVTAHVNRDGSLSAEVIAPAPAASDPELHFEFAGVVESVGDNTVVISGQAVQVSAETAATLQVGQTVTVRGVFAQNSFEADEVEQGDHTPEPTHATEPTRVATNTRAPEPTHVATNTHSPEPTRAATNTHSPEPTRGATNTRAPEPTRAPTNTRAPEPTRAATNTRAPEPTHEATQVIEPTHEPEPTHAATQVVEPTHEPEPTATRQPEPTHEPTATHQPESTATHVPEPTHEPTTVPTIEPTHEPTATHVPEPTHEATSVPTIEPTLEPTAVPTGTR